MGKDATSLAAVAAVARQRDHRQDQSLVRVLHDPNLNQSRSHAASLASVRGHVHRHRDRVAVHHHARVLVRHMTEGQVMTRDSKLVFIKACYDLIKWSLF